MKNIISSGLKFWLWLLLLSSSLLYAAEPASKVDEEKVDQKKSESASSGGIGNKRRTGTSSRTKERKDTASETAGPRGGGGGAGAAVEAAVPIAANEPNILGSSVEDLQTAQVDSLDNLRASVLDSEDGNRPIVKLLSDLVEENNPFRARKLILTILLRKGEALPVLKEALQTGSDATKWTVLSMLQKDLLWEETSTEIVAIIGDPNTSDKVLCRAIAAATAMNIEPAATIISPLINRENEDVRQVAILALGELKYVGAKNDLLNVLNYPSTRIAIAAAESLGKMDDPNGYSVASKYLDSSDWFVRKLAAEALGHIGTDEALSRLKLHLVSETSPMARTEIEIAMNRISMKRMTKPERIAHLRQLLDSEHRFVSRWAYKHMLEKFPDECVSIFGQRVQTTRGQRQRTAEIYLLLAEERTKGGGK